MATFDRSLDRLQRLCFGCRSAAAIEFARSKTGLMNQGSTVNPLEA